METLKPKLGSLIPIVGAIFGMGALGIDTVLPALPQIAFDLSPLDANYAQLTITMFVVGMGLGTLMGGPLSDWRGRRPIMLAGCFLYAFGAMFCFLAPTLLIVAASRVVQGVGASFTLVAASASVRDKYDGADMARIMSFAMMVFAMVPAIGPLLGQAILSIADWRTIFIVYIVFGGLLALAIHALLVETLDIGKRAMLRSAQLATTAFDVLSYASVRYAVTGLIFNMSILFSTLASIQPIFDKSFGRAQGFPTWFALIALAVFLSSFINGLLVKRFGMLTMLRVSFGAVATFSLVVAMMFYIAILPIDLTFPVYFAWTLSLFLLQGFANGNLNALAMQPVGHVAGLAASIINATGMLIGSLLAIPVGQAFDGTPLPLMLSVTVFAWLGFWAIAKLKTLKSEA